jgi:predicted RND superfamily exporter protein
MPALNAELVGTMQHDMRRLIAGAFLVMGLILGWLFRKPGGVIAPLIVVALAAIWTLGYMAATNTPVTLLTNIIPAFLAAVGLGDSIHVQAVFRDIRAQGVAHKEALIAAVASTGMPVLFTTLTTMVGLLSFQFAKMEAISEMGTFAAFGVGVAFLHSVTFLPIFLSFMNTEGFGAPASATGNKADITDRILSYCTQLSSTPAKTKKVLISGVLLLLVAAYGITQIAVYHNPVTWLPEGYQPRIHLETMDTKVGGTAQVNLVIHTDSERGLRDLDLLKRLEALEQHVVDFKHPTTGEKIVTSTSSILDVIKETNRALHEGDEDFYRLPDTQRGVSDALLLFESASPRDLQRLATADLSRSHITLRIHWMDATAYEPFTEHIRVGMDQFVGDAAFVQPTGSVYELVTIVSGLISDLLRSFSAALISITVMMILLLRNLRLGLIAMIPNLVPVAFIMGFMGFVGIDLDLTNLLIASIVIGVAVDNTVHYMYQWQAAYNTGATTNEAIQFSLGHAGRALVGTGFILALGFGVYLASNMLNIQRFGTLVGAACLFALFTNLIFAPALLRTIFGPNNRADTN